ncbi:MAG TPA: glycosyltransferase family 39 protein [Chthoniobacterales bacterium]
MALPRCLTFAGRFHAAGRYLALFVGLLILNSLGDGVLPLIDRDEPRFAEASREMRQSGDYLIPRVNGAYRFDKPPLVYWCQVAAMRIVGDGDLAVRLPSAVFMAATAVMAALWATKETNPQVGWWSGVIFGTCMQTFMHAHAAVADPPLVFFFTGACWAGWERMRRPASKRLFLAFYLALAAGFLAKGPIALLPWITPTVHRYLRERRVQVLLPSTLAGLLVVIGVVGLWGIPALVVTHGQFFNVGIGKHVVQRSLKPMESHGAPGVIGYLLFLPFYAVTLLVSFAPWSIGLGRAIRSAWRSGQELDRYLLLNAAVVFAVFTLIQTKLPHYVLPAFPLLAVVFARHRSPRFPVRAAAGTAMGVYVLIATVGFRWIEPAFPSKVLVEQLRPDLSPATRTGSVGYDEQSLVWYLRHTTVPFHEWLRAEDVVPFLAAPGPAVCVVAGPERIKVHVPTGCRTVDYSGYNVARWKTQPVQWAGLRFRLPLPERVDLLALIKAE